MTKPEADALRVILNSIMNLAAAADAILEGSAQAEVQIEEMPQPAGPRWLGDDNSPRIGA
jgi:hypothetical protein